ncbi:MerR family transcriptional regulator [Gordonia soli]|uniref:Putative MerR family transcriptional regulator n=1 Tax=Gordonia soli NBRC 108243 TaxID=1223545 RepID=M0QR23_9ACTN|nr:MerR family transcriptional regulator [Gordonia soli]GAC69862.1 putative MerR family transcriptional regulator [Gordonia soli NBRC 108243]
MLIGEVARRSGVSARMLRHYESLGLVTPDGRTSGGYRVYSQADVRRILDIESLRSLGLSLDEIGRALADPEFTPDVLVARLVDETRRRMDRDAELLARLERVRRVGPEGWEDVLGLIRLLRGLGSEYAALRQRAVLPSVDGTPRTPDLLAEAVLGETDTNVAGALRWALNRVGADVVPSLAAGMASDDVAVRRRAVSALAEIPGPATTEVLRRSLDDVDEDIRRRVVLALGARAVPAVIGALVTMVADGHNDVEAAELLGGFVIDPTGSHLSERVGAGDERAGQRIVGALVERLHHTDDPAVRLRLTQALAEIPADAARAALGDLTGDHDRVVALTAEAILAGRGR